MPIAPIAGTWQKFLVKAGVEIGGAVAAYLLTSLSEGTDDADPATAAWMRVTMKWRRVTPTGTSEDLAQCGLHVMNLTSGELDSTWTEGDLDVVQGATDTLMATLSTYQGAGHLRDSSVYHLMRFSPDTWPAKRFQDTGAPRRVRTLTNTAGAGSNQAYQVAATLTLKTPFPKHWGRIYIPGLYAAGIDSSGRITATARDGIRTAFQTFAGTLKASDMYVVVPVTQVDKQPAFGLLSVTSGVVDDIPDVQRSRRPKTVAARSITT